MNKIRLNIWNSPTVGWVRIDGVIQNSLQDEITLDESYDNATVKAINKDSSMCDAFSKFYVSVGEFETEKRYYIGSEKVVRIQMSDYYEHTYTLIEPTKLLERYKLFGLSVTQPLTGTKKTLMDVFQRVVKDISEKYNKAFSIDPNIDLSGISPEFEITNKATFFEFLHNYIGNKIGAMPRLLGDMYGGFNKITFDYFSQLSNTSNIYQVDGIENSIEENNACTFLEAEISNLVVENEKNEISLTYPPDPDYASVRSDTIRLEDDNVIIRLPYNIKKIIKLYINGNGNDIDVDTSAGNGYVSLFEYDISSSIVTEDEWLALEENSKNRFENVGEKTKNDTLYYTVGTNEIKNLSKSYKENAWQEDYPLARVLANSFLTAKKGKEIYYQLSSNHTVRTGILKATRPSTHVKPPKEVEFRIEYIPYIDTLTNQLNPIGNEKGSLTYNQSAETVNARDFGNAMWHEVQNQNSTYKQITALVSATSEIKNIGDIIDGYIITSVKRRFTGSKYIEVLYTSSQDFIRKSLYIQENREYRPFAIPSKTVVDRHILTNEFCFIGYNEKNIKSGGFKDVLFDYIDAYLRHNKDWWKDWTRIPTIAQRRQSKISAVLFKSIGKNRELGYFLLPCTAIAIGKSVQFDWAMIDNYSAGKYIVNPDAEVPTVRNAPYSFNGEFKAFEIILRNQLDAYTIREDITVNPAEKVDPARLPYYKDNDNNPITVIEELNIYKKYYMIDKDAGERIKGSIQFHFTSTESDIVVSSYFAENFPFVKLPTTDFYFCCLNKSINKYTENIEVDSILTQEKMEIASGLSTHKSVELNFSLFSIPSEINANMSWAIIDLNSLSNGSYKIAFGGNLQKLVNNNKTVYLTVGRSF